MSDVTTPHSVPFLEDSDSLGGIAAWTQALATWVNDNVGKVASGEAVVPITAANTAAVVAVTFPAGRFTVAPKVAVTGVISASGIVQGITLGVDSITTSGCNIRGARTAGINNVTAMWIAHQD